MTISVIVSFIIFNVLNVIIQTVKSIATIKCGKWGASIINALAYGLYTYIVVLTANDSISLWFKIIVVALSNLVGVYVVKVVEEKKRKIKLWKVEATIHSQGIEPNNDDCIIELKENNISFNYIDVQKYIILNCYCETQEESAKVKTILNKYKAKYFVSETKNLWQRGSQDPLSFLLHFRQLSKMRLPGRFVKMHKTGNRKHWSFVQNDKN